MGARGEGDARQGRRDAAEKSPATGLEKAKGAWMASRAVHAMARAGSAGGGVPGGPGGPGAAAVAAGPQMMACRPLLAMMFSRLSAGLDGWVSPCCHLRTVDAGVCR